MSSLLLASLLLSLQGQQPQTTTPPPQQKPPATQSQPDQDQEVVRITTNLVQIDAVVTKDGKQVTDLKAEDFELFEDGKPQSITNFSYVSIAPANSVNVAARPNPKERIPTPVAPAVMRPRDVRRTVALVVDDLGMSVESIGAARRHLRKFIDEQLEPNDLVAIIRTGGEVGALQQFTGDRRILYNAIDHLRWNQCSRRGVHVFAPMGGPVSVDDNYGPCGWLTTKGTLQILRFVLQGMRDLPGRKSMVVFSDDLPIVQQQAGPSNMNGDQSSSGPVSTTNENALPGSLNSEAAIFQNVAELAIRASVVIYAVDTRGLQYTGMTAMDRPPAGFAAAGTLNVQVPAIMRSRSIALMDNRQGHELLAKETGGYLVRNSNDFGLHGIMDDQRGYYLIGFRPDDETFDKRFHQIKIRVKGKGLTVRTREGFYGVTNADSLPKDLTAHEKMIRALLSPFGANEIPVRLTTFFANDATAGSILRSFLYLDARDLTFTDEAEGIHKATFDLSSVIFGDNGKVVSEEDRVATLQLHDDAYDRAKREGVVYGFDIPLKQSGTFQFRVAMRDTASSRYGAAGQFVEVPNLRNDRLALSGIVVSKEAASARPNQSTSLDDEITGGPAVRRFHQGSIIIFAYGIYKSQIDPATRLPQLTTQTRIFRDGKPIYAGTPIQLDLAGQTDLTHVTAGSRFQIGPELPPGQYVLQIIVEDRLAKPKQNIATQSIDFEVTK
jgi:VWFA-related protein